MTNPDPHRQPPSPPVATPNSPYPAPNAQAPAQPSAAQPVYAQPVYPQHGYPPSNPQPAQPQSAQPQPVYPQVPQQPAPVTPYAGPPPTAHPPTAYATPIPVPARPVPVQPAAAPNQPTFNTAAAPQAPSAWHPTPARPVPVSGAAQAVTARPAGPAMPAAPSRSPSPATRPIPVGASPNGAPRPVPITAAPSTVRTETPDDEDAPSDVADKAVRGAPPWLVSLVVHMIALIVLGLLYLPRMFESTIQLDVVYAEQEGEQLLDDLLEMTTLEPIDITEPVLSEDFNLVEDPFAAPPDIPELVLDSVTASSEIQAPSIGLALTGRDPGMKKALLAAYGGTAATEEAVKRGLEWLKRNQQKDGMWSLTGPYSSAASIENRESATAMALLAFQGAGNTHKTGEYKNVVAKGWDGLLKSLDKDGNFFREGAHHHRLYTQAQCTIAICELYGMTKDEKYREPAQRTIDYAIKSQSPLGGWRYTPRQDSDTSVTGWFVMALQSGRMAGLSVPSPELDNINKFLDSVTPDGIHYSYKPQEGTTPTMTAEALLCRQYLGWAHDDPRLVQGVNYVNANPITFADMNVYYWYYATQVTHHMEGEYWDKWNKVMRQVLPEQQVKTGAESGSWNPGDDRWGGHGGRLYTTCLCIYMLEVYYRHLPIYKYRLN